MEMRKIGRQLGEQRKKLMEQGKKYQKRFKKKIKVRIARKGKEIKKMRK